MDSDRLIAENDEGWLMARANDPTTGYVVFKSDGHLGPQMPVASILSHGDSFVEMVFF